MKIKKGTYIWCGIFLFAVLLFTPTFTNAQSQKTRNAANKSWSVFWTKFSKAVGTKNRRTIKTMASRDFFDGGGGGTVSEWIQMLDTNKIWHLVQNSVNKGTKFYGNFEGMVWRVTKDDHLLFRYEKTGWKFYGVMGD